MIKKIEFPPEKEFFTLFNIYDLDMHVVLISENTIINNVKQCMVENEDEFWWEFTIKDTGERKSSKGRGISLSAVVDADNKEEIERFKVLKAEYNDINERLQQCYMKLKNIDAFVDDIFV